MTMVIPFRYKSGEAEWYPAVFEKLLDALQIWKYLFIETEIFWVKVRSGEILLFSVLKALRNIINPNLNRLNHNLYRLELSSFQHWRNKTKPNQTPAVKNQLFIMQQMKTLQSWRFVLFSFSFLQFWTSTKKIWWLFWDNSTGSK